MLLCCVTIQQSSVIQNRFLSLDIHLSTKLTIMKITNYILFITLFGLFTSLSVTLSSQTVKVNGKQTWTDTGIEIQKGDQISISASGTVYANGTVYGGPDGISNRPDWDVYCVVKGKPHEGLIMKIGNGKAVFVGSSFTYTAQESGKLYLGVNDTDVGNNKGEFIANVTVENKKKGQVYTITVPGTKIWTDTKIDIWKGQHIYITAEGTVYANSSVYGGPEGISNRPDWDVYCLIKGKPHEALIMKIGDGKVVFVGKTINYTASNNGRLYLGVNDNDVGNNKGEFRVKLELGPTQNLQGGDIIVSGKKQWTRTGIHIEKGDRIEINASGKVYANSSVFGNPDGITNRPDWDYYCIVKGKAHAGLIARIGDEKAFFVGSSYSFTADASGELILGVNDNDTGNNKGEFSVSVSKK